MGIEKWIHEQIDKIIEFENDKEFLILVVGMIGISLIMFGIIG